MEKWTKKERYTFEDLLAIVRLLRAPDGCPWDRVQTHHSIRNNFIEETYEAVEAIDTDNMSLLKEELGDVLLQVALHTRMEEEQGSFDMTDVTTGICEKLIYRHPHIFGSVEADDVDTVLNNWDALKKKEKGQQTAADSLQAVAKSLPALMRAEKVQSRARKAGFGFESADSCRADMQSELQELEQALASEDGQEIFHEAGDVLFSAVNLARMAGVPAEEALGAATDRFIQRLTLVEQFAAEEGKTLSELSAVEADRLWKRAKEQ